MKGTSIRFPEIPKGAMLISYSECDIGRDFNKQLKEDDIIITPIKNFF